jgi:hypothetical protein
MVWQWFSCIMSLLCFDGVWASAMVLVVTVWSVLDEHAPQLSAVPVLNGNYRLNHREMYHYLS